MSILIISNKIDPHVDVVIKALENQFGVSAKSIFRFNTEDFCSDYSIMLKIEKDCFDLCLNNKHYFIDLQNISSVYYRRPIKPIFPQLKINSVVEFATKEAWFFIPVFF